MSAIGPELYNRYKKACAERGEISYCYEAWMENIVNPIMDNIEAMFFENQERKISNDR